MAKLKYYNTKTNAWETVDSTFGTVDVKTVNGVEPDANGNIEIGIPEMPEINYPVTSVNGMTGDVVIEVGSEQVQSNLSQNDPEAPDYVKGRTHYEESNQTVIEWDGSTGGRDSIAMTSGTVLYKVSDLTPTKDELLGALAVVNGAENPITEDMLNVAGSNFLNISVLGYVAYEAGQITDDYDDSWTVPSTGIYFADMNGVHFSSITYGSTVVHPLDEKFIPDSIARKSDIPENVNGASSWNDLLDKPDALPNPKSLMFTGSVNVSYDGSEEVSIEIPTQKNITVNGVLPDENGNIEIAIESGGAQSQVDWKQNDETATDYVKNRTHWKEEATEMLFSETNIDFSDTVSRPSTFQLDEGAYIVTIDGETYYYELLTYNGINYIGDIQGNPILVCVQEGDLLIAMADSGVHSVEIYRDKTTYHKLDPRYIDAMQEFIIPVDFNNATLTDSETSGHFAGSKRYKVAIETPYYEIVKEYSAGKHLIVRLDNLGYQSYFFALVSTDGTSFMFESTFIMSPNTTRITNLCLELGQQSIGSDTAKVFLQTTTIETNMPPEPASAIADLTEAPTAEDFNALLAALRSAGYLATE